MNSSDTKSSAFRTHFKAKLKKNSKSFVLLLILQLLGFPQMAATSLYISQFFQVKYIKTENFHEIADLPTISCISDIVALLSLAAVLLIGISTGISNFRYLHSKPETDIVFSLPVTKKKLFAADYLSGLIIYLVPGIIALAAAAILVWINPEHRLWVTEYDNHTLQIIKESAGISWHAKRLCSNHEFLPFIKTAAEFIPLMIMLYTFTVMIMVCCGTSFEAFVYFFVSGISVTAFSALLKITFETSFPNNALNYYMFSEAELFSPFGGIIHTAKKLSEFTYLFPDFSHPDYSDWRYAESGMYNTSWGIWHILFAAVYFLAAWRIFIKRKAEDTSKPFSCPWIFYISSFCITGSIIFIMNTDTEFMIDNYYNADYSDIALVTGISVIISAVIFLIMLLVRYRGIKIKRPAKQVAFFLGSFIFTCTLTVTMKLTQGFGMMYYIPAPEKVSSVEIFGEYDRLSCELTDFSSIKAVTDIHSKINDETRTWYINGVSHIDEMYESGIFFNRKYNLKAISRTNNSFVVTYLMKNGKQISRRLITVNTDYSHTPLYEIYNSIPANQVTEIEDLVTDTLNSEQIFCGRTEFAEEISNSHYSFITSARISYPPEYRLTDYDKNILKELLNHAYYYYCSPDECFFLSADPENPFNLVIPYEYKELYESFLNSGKKENLEWEFIPD